VIRRFSWLATTLVLALALAGGACHKNITFETPNAKVAYDADQALQRVGRVQTLVIDMEAKGSLSTANARAILQGCRVLDISLPAATGGWRTAAQTAAWEAARGELPTLGAMPETWQQAAKDVWKAVKAKVPTLETDANLSVLTAAVDTALASL
jgi:hypothetical protein